MSILKKLSAGEQSISNAKYTTVESLQNYYLERADDIEIAIQEVNNQKQNVDLVVKDIYSKKIMVGYILKVKKLKSID
ncbi:hypothetical protein V070_02639 [Staphylococcus aureus C0673]|nr:hypothetical protein V070_02639 [Staphylococcus aureus C0673]